MDERRSASKKGLTPGQWVRIRKITQILFLGVFLLIFLWSRREFYLNPSLESGFKEKLVNLPLQLDPLVMIANSIASRKVLAGSLLAIITLVITALLGRVWCGWFCPMGTVLDWLPLRTWNKVKPAVPEKFRGIKYVLLLVIFIAASLGNLSLLIFDPLTIGYRTLTIAIWPGLDQLITGAEILLLQIPVLSSIVGGFDSLIRPTIFPPYPAIYRYGWLYLGFFMAVIGLNAFAPRFWCRYLCPLGGLLGLLGKVSLVHCEISTGCTQCGVCIPACPTGAIQENGGVYCDPGECTMCLICKADCPSGKVQFPLKTAQFIHQPYDVTRKKALLSLGTAVIGVGLLENPWVDQKVSPVLIRPPGVINKNLLSSCIRCGECSTVCPTNAIQMAVLEAGVDGFWTPVLVPRIGYCDYSCQACGQVCPVEAIPPLTLEEKRKQIIGTAEIDQNRCLPWAENQECIVCEEMCPIPDKAIRLEEVHVVTPEGEIKILQRPHVIHNECIGCGICENKCPLTGEAAIQIQIHFGHQHGNQNQGGRRN
ncbi:MAG: 4Fe-4S binding protein [Chloroflexi bacterium]|nr:4Fe-4S binding protein [Chloroflexota bacterium]